MLLHPRLVFLLAGALIGACAPETQQRPRAEYDKETGGLRKLTFDANQNGRHDAVSYMDGTRIVRVELDLDENGKVERWDFYNEDRSLEKVGFSQRNDGVMDSQVFYTPDGHVARIEVSTRRDGRFNRIEFYEGGTLARSEEDTNGDGGADKWETYRHEPKAAPGEPRYAITSVAFDDTGRGVPQRRFVYAANGSIARAEFDPDGDGIFAPADKTNTK